MTEFQRYAELHPEAGDGVSPDQLNIMLTEAQRFDYGGCNCGVTYHDTRDVEDHAVVFTEDGVFLCVDALVDCAQEDAQEEIWWVKYQTAELAEEITDGIRDFIALRAQLAQVELDGPSHRP